MGNHGLDDENDSYVDCVPGVMAGMAAQARPEPKDGLQVHNGLAFASALAVL
jgi:hypothetical protein